MPPELLRNVATGGWLSATPPRFRDLVLDRAVVRRYGPREVLHEAGDESGGMYGVAAGTIRLMLSAVDHGPYCGHLLRPGSWAGDVGAITGGARLGGLISSGESVVLYLARAAITGIVAEDPACWRHFVAGTMINLNTAFGAIADLMLRDHRKRLVAVLLRAAGARSEMPPVERTIEVDLSQADIATMANVTRTTAGATLRRFEQAGLLKTGYGKVTILSPARLRRMLME
ncbi:MAG: Crp/Fnr family transcriptional regulator [Bauldia sp.]|nr:Crp/Fnr family transcriptional regulator [Bauldia sp.]